MEQVDEIKRQEVYDQIRDAADELLRELSVNLLVRKALLLFFVDGQVKKLLAL